MQALQRIAMSRIFHPIFYLLASVTQKELARYIQYLKTENRILRDKLPKRITVTPLERQRLLKAGRELGKAINELITIVTPRTFARWLKAESESTSGDKKPTRKPGRPRTADEIRALVVRIAKENGWGFSRVLGELAKLGIHLSRQTVKNIIKAHGLDPGPKRGEGTWDEFLKIHAATLWQCDFLTVRTWTCRGLVELYLLVFLNVGSRKVWISAPTAHPNGAWVAQQGRNFGSEAAAMNLSATILIHDHDAKLTREFDGILRDNGIQVKKPAPRSPNLNAYVERFIQTLRVECLDHFVILGERHLRHLVKEFVAHYHAERPHQSLDNRPLTGTPPSSETTLLPPAPNDVVCHERLGGLLKHYTRRAA